MGLFNLIKKKRADNDVEVIKESKQPASDSRSLITRNAFDYLPVHLDILDLLWVGDGPKKNYVNKPVSSSKFEVDGIVFTMTYSGASEPSAIYPNLPIQKPTDRPVERPPYYPNYRDLTPEQKGVYWSLLADPYNTEIDIGYVFILYYGLERHLMNGNFEKAFDVILKLRDVHTNKSFQSYSGNALVLSCLLHQKPEMALRFLGSLDKDHELSFSNNLFLMTHYGFRIPLKAQDIMRMARTFEFENTNYIKKYPDLFKETLIGILKEKLGQEEVLINEFISSTDHKKLTTEKLRIFSNISLSDNEISVPVYTEHFKFKKAMYESLEQAHEKVKADLPALKKNGAVKEAELPKTPVKILEFDKAAEITLLDQLNSNQKDLLSKHFTLISLQDLYYRYRALDQKYLDLCIEYCIQDINQLHHMQDAYKVKEIQRIQSTAYLFPASEIRKEIKAVENEGFIGRIPAFERLAIIYERQGKIKEAIDICDQAIAYTKSLNTSSQDYVDRKENLLKKLNKV